MGITLTEVLIIAGLTGTGVLWVGAVLGMFQIGWKSIGDPVLKWLKGLKR